MPGTIMMKRTTDSSALTWLSRDGNAIWAPPIAGGLYHGAG